MPPATVPVLLPLPLDHPFDYAVGGAPPPPGSYVPVPFGAREVAGVVWHEAAPPRRGAPGRLREVAARFDLPPMPAPLRLLVAQLAAATLTPLGAALRLALPVPAALPTPPARLGYRSAASADGTGLSAPRRRVLDALADGVVLAGAELARRAGVGAGVIKAMAEAGLILPSPLPEPPPPPGPDPAAAGVVLTPAQSAAAAVLRRAVAGAAPPLHLLEGVPGAGKTEVYLEAVAAALEAGRQVLVLLPEIALGAQWLARFRRRFGAEPCLWHSALTQAQRRHTWREIARGRARVVVGARSALFLPLAELGLIVVDEEQDASFKQQDGTLYHARDMAMARARLEPCACVLASATPALETLARVGAAPGLAPEPGTGHLHLPARHGERPMPAVALVDLRRDRPPRGAWLAPSLRQALGETLARGEQSLLFLNRRGYAPLSLCRACGHRLMCPNCTAWLVLHRLRGRLVCHHCGHAMAPPPHCPACGSVDSLAASGPGVERVAEEVAALWPGARTALLTSDQPGTPSAAAALLQAMEDGALDILIGTQMVAKGHHFPGLTLVGVVDGDMGLSGGDLRAAERSFQLLYQVAGRAGRAERPGRVLIQTHLPEHPVMQALASGARARFVAEELAERRAFGLPPYGRLAALILSGRDRDAVAALGRELARRAPADERVRVLGPAPAPLALLRGRHRQRLLVQARLEVDLPGWLRAWLAGVRPKGDLRLVVDVDPYSFL